MMSFAIGKPYRGFAGVATLSLDEKGDYFFDVEACPAFNGMNYEQTQFTVIREGFLFDFWTYSDNPLSFQNTAVHSHLVELQRERPKPPTTALYFCFSFFKGEITTSLLSQIRNRSGQNMWIPLSQEFSLGNFYGGYRDIDQKSGEIKTDQMHSFEDLRIYHLQRSAHELLIDTVDCK
jgi:hypothetical protein